MGEPTLPRQDLEAALAARQELGAEHEDHLVAGFLERVEKGLDRRIDERLAQRKVPGKPVAGDGAFVITLVSLGVSIPMLGIASGSALMMALVLLALVAINAIVWRR